jgi:hypothetical protein
MPYQKGTVPDRLKGKGIPQEFVDQFVNVFNSVLKGGGDEASAFRQAYGVMNKALRKAGYRQGKDGKWHKGSRKEEMEPEVLSFPSGGIVLEDGQSRESAMDSGLTYSGTALVDFAVSQQGSWQERYYSPEYNDKCMTYTNEYMERGYPVTVYNRHFSAQSSTENPIGKIIDPLWREGDEIRYRARISPTEKGKEAMILIFDEVMHPTSVRQYECKAALRRIVHGREGKGNSDDEEWILELLEGRIGGIDFCDQPGINGAGIRRLESAPEFLPTTKDVQDAEMTVTGSGDYLVVWDDGEIETMNLDDDSDTEDDMDWKDISLEDIKENRPDLLAEHTVTGLEVLAAANAALQARIKELEDQEMPPDLSQENEALKEALVAAKEQVDAAQFDIKLEQAAHTHIGRIVAKMLREKAVTVENLEAMAKELRDEAIMESVAAFRPGEASPTTKVQGQTHRSDDEDIDFSTIPDLPFKPVVEMSEFEKMLDHTI